jgi:hypothetical protein
MTDDLEEKWITNLTGAIALIGLAFAAFLVFLLARILWNLVA